MAPCCRCLLAVILDWEFGHNQVPRLQAQRFRGDTFTHRQSEVVASVRVDFPSRIVPEAWKPKISQFLRDRLLIHVKATLSLHHITLESKKVQSKKVLRYPGKLGAKVPKRFVLALTAPLSVSTSQSHLSASQRLISWQISWSLEKISV